MGRKITTILFDFDGTLLDTNELIIQTFEQVLNKHVPGRYTRETILPFLGPTLKETFTLVDPSNAEQMMSEYRAWNLENHDRLVQEFDGVSDTLRKLKAQGFKLAIVSTKRNAMVHKGIEQLEVGNIFDVVIGLDDVKNAKPDPEPLLLALEKLGSSPEEAVMVGDNSHDIVGGHNAGVRTVAVAWSAKGETFLQQFKPDYMLQHISELLPIVNGEM